MTNKRKSKQITKITEHAPDEALRWLLSRIRSHPPAGLGLQANVKAHESSKRTAFYISSPCNVYVFRSCILHKEENNFYV